MGNTGRIKKGKQSQRFTVIPNDPLQSKNLSWKAKGLLSFLLSLPEDWEIYKTNLCNWAADGRDGTTSAFDELVAAGYIKAEEVRDLGRFKGFNYTVESQPITEIPKSVKPKAEEPKTEKPKLQKKKVIKEEVTKEEAFEDYPFKTEELRTAWADWIQYKKTEFRHSYKSRKYELIQIQRLFRIADWDEAQAVLIIRNCIELHWQGLYLSNETRTHNQDDNASVRTTKKGKANVGEGAFPIC